MLPECLMVDHETSRRASECHCQVLIVEDDSEFRELMGQLLTLEGFQSATVANGKEALEYLSRGDMPDVILLDLIMPVMDGWEFRRRQQADPTLSRIPVIVWSPLDFARARDLQPYAFVQMPNDFDKLLHLIHLAVEKRGPCPRP
jgi:two-component system, chemotaxis family, chemotaxis protein CheY